MSSGRFGQLAEYHGLVILNHTLNAQCKTRGAQDAHRNGSEDLTIHYKCRDGLER